MSPKINLSKFKKKKLSKESNLKFFFWYLIDNIIVNSCIPGSTFRVLILRFFGAKIGKNVIIKP